MLKRVAFICCVLFLSNPVVWAEDLQQAVDAFDKGAYKTAREQLILLADKGDRDAQTLLGLLYSEGRGTKKDIDKARHWYMQAANNGQADAAFLLGLSYLHENSTENDNRQAVRWVKHAARKDNLLAQRFMALAYEKGWMNIKVDKSKSQYWWKRYEELKLAKGNP